MPDSQLSNVTRVETAPSLLLGLNARQREYVERSKSKNTKRAYKNAWNDFSYFCAHIARIQALPASPQTVADYLQYLADGASKISTINQRVAAIAFFHRTAGKPDPTIHPLVTTLMQGIRRERVDVRAEEIRQVEPLTRDELFQICIALPEDLRGKRDKALLLLGFAIARRESELAALNVRDVIFSERGMTVAIRKSKTDQYGEGRKKIIEHLADDFLCPVCALRAWLADAEITGGAIFRKVDRWNKVWKKRINARTVAYIVKRNIYAIGRDPKEFAGHSLRAGFVTQAAADGVPIHEIQDVTDHKSGDMVRRYIRNRGLGAQRTIRRVLGEQP